LRRRVFVTVDSTTYPTHFFSSGTASSSFVELVPRLVATNRPKTTCGSILRRRSTMGMNEFPSGALQICDDEEGELPYDGPDIPDDLIRYLLSPNIPIEPVLSVAKVVAASLMAQRALEATAERGACIANEDQITDSFDFNTDEGSDVESGSVQTVPSPIMAQTSPWSPPQALNSQPFFASAANASISTEERATNFSTSSNAECTAWDISATIPETPFAIVSSNPSQPRDAAPLDTSQIAGPSEAAWNQPTDLSRPMSPGSSIQNITQHPFQPFGSAVPLGQNSSSVPAHSALHNGMEEASGLIPENLQDQNSVANSRTADMPYADLVDRTAAIGFITDPPFLDHISFSAMPCQPDVMGSFQQPDDQIWLQLRGDQAQEQQQQLVFPEDSPLAGLEYATNDETRYMSIPPSPSLSDSRQDELPWGGMYVGPTLHILDSEDAAPTQVQLFMEQCRFQLDDPYQRQSFDQHDPYMQQ
ncbi:hypothetical protein PspLS_07861, partial [Pyricularia sp. CBS 133598]